MKKAVAIIIVGVLLSAAFNSCTKDDSNPVNGKNPPITPLPPAKQLLQGGWRNITTQYFTRYVTYDSATRLFSEKLDHGYNFRIVDEYTTKLDSVQIWREIDTEHYSSLYWTKWNTTLDTLTLSDNASFLTQLKFVRDSTAPQASDWVEDISQVWVSYYPIVTPGIRALAYAGNFWYVLTGAGWDDGMLYKINCSTGTRDSISFPSATAMDVANGTLWLAGGQYLEKRNLADTSLIARYTLPPYITSTAGLAVMDSIIYLKTFDNELIKVSTNGVFIQEVDTYEGLLDIMFDNGLLWGVTTLNTVNEIDPVFLKSMHSYYLAGCTFPITYSGIANHNGKVAVAVYSENLLGIWEFNAPEGVR